MSTTPYKNIPQLAVTDYICRNDGRACALLSGTVLVFELDASLVRTASLTVLSNYLRILGVSAVYVIAWGYDAQGNYKPGYYNAIMLTWGVGNQIHTSNISVPSGVAAGDTWYFAMHMAPFNKSLLKAVLETL